MTRSSRLCSHSLSMFRRWWCLGIAGISLFGSRDEWSVQSFCCSMELTFTGDKRGVGLGFCCFLAMKIWAPMHK